MDNNNVWEEEEIQETTEEKPSKKTLVKRIIALSTGILSLPFMLGGYIPVIGWISWIVSMIFTIVTKILIKKDSDCKLKKGAHITSKISLIANIVSFCLYLVIDIAIIVLAIIFGPKVIEMITGLF